LKSTWNKSTNVFEYNFRGLLTGLNTYTEYSKSPDCSGYNPLAGITWNYSYNPSGEREQKRLVSTPLRNFGGGVYAWEYYLLGGNNEQLAVYQGVEQSDEVIAGLAPDGSSCSIPNPPNGYAPVGQPSVSKVFFYPAEFNVYGLGGAPLTWRPDSVGHWRKEYKLFDHLGSVRTVLRKGLDDNSYELREQLSYEPFGGVKNRLYCTGSVKPDARLKYIGKQKDGESSLADYGVRKYDSDLGQFTSPDPLWEKYYAWTPYHYCRNNPMSRTDRSGFGDNAGFSVQNNSSEGIELFGGYDKENKDIENNLDGTHTNSEKNEGSFILKPGESWHRVTRTTTNDKGEEISVTCGAIFDKNGEFVKLVPVSDVDFICLADGQTMVVDHKAVTNKNTQTKDKSPGQIKISPSKCAWLDNKVYGMNPGIVEFRDWCGQAGTSVLITSGKGPIPYLNTPNVEVGDPKK